MDIGALASSLTTVLGPSLPYLLKAGEKVVAVQHHFFTANRVNGSILRSETCGTTYGKIKLARMNLRATASTASNQITIADRANDSKPEPEY